MIYGDQWNCPCGWANFFLRKRCRNCGREKHVNAALTPAEAVINQVHRRQPDDEPKP